MLTLLKDQVFLALDGGSPIEDAWDASTLTLRSVREQISWMEDDMS